MSKFFCYSTYGEILDIAMHLKFVENQEVIFHVSDPEYKKIGDGILEKEEHPWRREGQGWIWIVDGCETADYQDYLRGKGEFVFGSSIMGAKLEEDRQMGQDLFKRMGLRQPESHNFKDIGQAIEFVQKHSEKRWILKQNGNAPKSLNHKTKFDGCIDMLYHLAKLEKSWNEAEFGPVDFDMMEQVEGLEVAVSGFFNGTDFLCDETGKTVAFLNFEHKKECNDDLGDTTGETGTVFLGANSDHKLVKMLLENEELIKTLRATKLRGVFDINGCLTKDGYVGFEPTMRPGIPSSSYEFLSGAGMITKTSKMFEAVAKGQQIPLKIWKGTGMVLVVTARPYPVEADIEKEATSFGEKLWLMRGKDKIEKEFDLDQRLHIHLENFHKDGEDYLVATKNGYLLTVTMRGKKVKDTREKLIEYIKNNIYVSGMKWRSDIGLKLEEKGF